MPYANNQGVRIHYEIEGEGPHLVLIHGFTGSLDDWREFGYTETLKRNHQVILVDTRGHGASDKPHNPGAYETELLVGDVLAVLDQLKLNFRFIILGDSAATPRPVGDAIFSEMLSQMERLKPEPLFLANLGDFAGPGTIDRHEHYLRLAERVSLPNICVMGNHDRDEAVGWENFRQVHGPLNFQFTYGHCRFIVLNCHHGSEQTREEDLTYLETCLRDDDHPHRIVLMHMPPNLNNHYSPHSEWGFSKLERQFLSLVKAHDIKLVCCAHVIAYDYYVHDGIPYVVSGGGGWGLCTHFAGECHGQKPPYRGSFYHFVEIIVQESGAISGRVIQAFEGTRENPAYSFGKKEAS